MVLASNRGAPRHPDWYYNLVAHSTTTVEIGAETWSVRARVAAPEERRKVIDRLVAESPSVASPWVEPLARFPSSSWSSCEG